MRRDAACVAETPDRSTEQMNLETLEVLFHQKVGECIRTGFRFLREQDKREATALAVKGAWFLGPLPDGIVIELPDGTLKKARVLPETPISKHDLADYIGKHPACLDSQPVPRSLLGSYGLVAHEPEHSKEIHKTPLPGLVEITSEMLGPKRMAQVLDDYQHTIEAGGCEIRPFALADAESSGADDPGAADGVAAFVLRDRSASPPPRYCIVFPAPGDLWSLWFEALVNTALRRAEDSCESPEAWSGFGREGVEALVVSKEEADRFYRELVRYLHEDHIEIERRKMIGRICDALGIT